jgi:GH24 family phage-related lysozyme (muramidase)
MPEISEFDHEFLTAGSQSAEGEKLAGLVQQNLTPEEQKRLEEIMPILEEFNMLILKAQTGEFPEGAEEMGLTNGQGVPEQGMMEGRVPQDMQNQQRPPLQAVEGQMPQNAPEMMSGGGKVDRFDPEGKGYDIIMAEKAGLKPKTAKNYGDVQNVGHMLSSARLADLVNNNVLAKEDLEKYNLPIDGYLLLKGMKHDTVDKEINAPHNLEYKKVPTPLGERYIGFPKKMAIGGGVAAGPVGVIDKQGADDSGVADDVPAKSDGFVINAAAVRHAGLKDINDMIQNAKEYAKKQGMKLNFGKTPVDAEKILVSNGEVVIPDVLADIIGYDRLEKINKRGEKETEKVIQEEKQQQQPPPPQKPTQPVMRAAEGGQVKDEEGQVEELLPAEIPQEPYVYKNPETAEFLKEAEGTIAYQTKTGSYDPKTKEFLTYPDSKGKDTIGYGTTENVRKDMRISEKEADMSLDQRIDQEVSALMSDKIPRKFLDNPKTKTAIVSLQYNLGRSGWPKAKEALQKGDIDNFLFYAYDPSPEAANTYLLESEGLLNRRNKEMKLFKEGLQEMGLDN